MIAEIRIGIIYNISNSNALDSQSPPENHNSSCIILLIPKNLECIMNNNCHNNLTDTPTACREYKIVIDLYIQYGTLLCNY